MVFADYHNFFYLHGAYVIVLFQLIILLYAAIFEQNIVFCYLVGIIFTSYYILKYITFRNKLIGPILIPTITFKKIIFYLLISIALYSVQKIHLSNLNLIIFTLMILVAIVYKMRVNNDL